MQFFKKTKNGIQCLACNHYCIIQKNSFGICGVRQNVNNKLNLITHSKPCSLHLDPIEKKPLYHFLPGSEVSSIGFFGCNFRCDFCQNSEISFCKGSKAQEKVDSLTPLSPKDFISSALESKAKSVAFTYNEPAISIEYNLEAMTLAKKAKLKTIYVTNGYESKEQMHSLKGKLDAANIDLKSFNPKFYNETCGAEFEKVLSTIKLFKKAKIHIELTTLIIPKKNDSKEELREIAKWIASLDKNIPWHVSAFFPQHLMNNVPPTSELKIKEAIKIGKESGLNFVYGGNTRNPLLNNTFCPKCNSLLIDRSNYVGEIKGLEINKKAKCKNCGKEIKGIF